MRWNTPPTPGVLAPVRVYYPGHQHLIDPIRPTRGNIATSPHRLICDASAVRERLGHPRAVPVFRCTLRPDMPSPKTPESSTLLSSRAATSTLAFAEDSAARHSHCPRNPFHAGDPLRGFHGSPICYGLPVCLPPCTDPTSFPAVGDFYFQAFNEIGPLLDMTTAVAGPLCWWDFHPLEWQLDSLHEPTGSR